MSRNLLSLFDKMQLNCLFPKSYLAFSYYLQHQYSSPSASIEGCMLCYKTI